MKNFLYALLILCGTAISAQNEEQAPLTKTPSSLTGLSITGRSYPIFIDGEEHSSFMVRYGFSKSVQVELQGFYDTYLMTNRVRKNIVGKLYLNDKLYLISGLEMESEVSKYGRKPDQFRLGFVTGAGYDISENFMLEVKSNFQLNNSNMGVYGESITKMPAVYTVGSKFKF